MSFSPWTWMASTITDYHKRLKVSIHVAKINPELFKSFVEHTVGVQKGGFVQLKMVSPVDSKEVVITQHNDTDVFLEADNGDVFVEHSPEIPPTQPQPAVQEPQEPKAYYNSKRKPRYTWRD